MVSDLPYTIAIDERGAAFAALGMSKVSGRPGLVVCTSGSALGHYLPAIIEADESRVPLIVLSADRPIELQHGRSAQTIDQTQLFGNKVRAFMDLGAPTSNERALRALRRKAAQGVARALGPIPGAVHLNFAADKPLEPRAAETPTEHDLQARVTTLLSHGVPKVYAAEAHVSVAALSALLDLARTARRPALSIGPVAPSEAESVRALYAVARRARWPVFAETTSQLRFLGTENAREATRVELFEHLYSLPKSAELFPDFIVHVGTPLTSGSWHRTLEASPGSELVLVSSSDWPDPEDRARLVINADPGALARALAGRLPTAPEDFTRALLAASQRASASAESVARDPTLPFADQSVFRALDRVLADGDQLVLGNSLPVRLADTWLRPDPERPRQIRCLSQRGANGIDGLISGAIGASLCSTGRSVLVLGDVSALHDVSALALLREATPNLTVLVINNRGGRIFEQLPVAQLPREQLPSMDPWLTPHPVDLWRLGQAFGVPSVLADTEQSLELALRRAHSEPGPTWIEARVAPDGARRWSTALLASLAESWAATA